MANRHWQSDEKLVSGGRGETMVDENPIHAGQVGVATYLAT